MRPASPQRQQTKVASGEDLQFCCPAMPQASDCIDEGIPVRFWWGTMLGWVSWREVQRNATYHETCLGETINAGSLSEKDKSWLYLTVAGTPVMKATSLPLELTRTPSTQSSW